MSSSGTGGGLGGRTSPGTGGTQSPDAGGTSTVVDPGDGPTTLTGLEIEDNPKNVLSAFVSWTTDKPGNSVVQFGQGKYEWEVADSATVTSHKVLIIGMYAGKAYQVKAMSSNGGTPVSATGNYTTKALPAQIPVVKVTSSDATKVQPGWTLMNLIKSSTSMGPISDYPAAAVMYDLTGQPVWYYIDGTTKDFGGAIATSPTDKGVMIGPVVAQSGDGESPREVDWAGNTLWECKDPLCGGTGPISHEAIKLSNGKMPGTGTTYHSRVQEFKIDEAKKTATVSWEFPGSFNVDAWYKSTWYNAYYGDANRMANGNVLITAGSVGSNAGDARIFEVQKADGKVVWEFKLDAGYGVFRSNRITPPLVKALTTA